MAICRSKIVEEGFDAVMRKWAIETGTTLTVSRRLNNDVLSRTVLTPEDAARSVTTETAPTTKDSEARARNAAKLSVESSKKSVKASHVAVAGGVLAVAAGCTVM